MSDRRNHTLRPRWFHVLLAISDRDRHGSDIVRDVLEQSGGELRLWPAMLYNTLDQLSDRGLIEELTRAKDRPAGASARRRYFRITRAGRRALTEETDRLARLARLAQSRNAKPAERAT